MTLTEQLNRVKRLIVLESLWEHDLNLTWTAFSLGIHRNTINRLCKELQIDLIKLRRERNERIELNRKSKENKK